MLLYTYISRFPVNPHYQQQFYLRPSFIAFFNFAHKRPMFAFAGKSEYTLGFAQRIAHNGSHAEIGAFRMGGGITTLGAFRTFTNIPGPGIRKVYTLPLLGLGRVCSRRTKKAFGAAMRLCASLLRGVAAPLGCVIFLQFGDVAVFSLCAQYFLNVRGGGGITTLGVLRVLSKRWAAACQKGAFAVF